MTTGDRAGGTGAMLAYGAVGGVGAHLVGYLLTYLIKAPMVADALGGVRLIATLLGIDAVATWRGVGWLFYNAHFVRTRVPGPTGPTFVDFLGRTEGGWQVTALVLVLLGFAGAIVAFRTAPTGTVGRGAIHGAAIGVGYLPLTAGGTLLTAQPIPDTAARIGPDVLPTLLVAGLLVPILVGAIGGGCYAVSRRVVGRPAPPTA